MNDNETNNINNLIGRLANGDNVAFEELMLLTYKDLFLLSYSYLKDRMLAEDIVIETFIKLIEKIHTIENIQNLMGYLHTIAVNKSIDIIRKRKREVFLEDVGLKHTAANLNSERENVWSALSMLKNNERLVLLLWNYDYTLNEISQKSGFTINQVRLFLYKAKKNFSIEYKKENAD